MTKKRRDTMMITGAEERLRAALTRLGSHEQKEVLDFAEFLAQRREENTVAVEHLSDEEHRRMIAALDRVVALSQETGSPVSNRNHDIDLYGGR
jgi:hypothetical protein